MLSAISCDKFGLSRLQPSPTDEAGDSLSPNKHVEEDEFRDDETYPAYQPSHSSIIQCIADPESEWIPPFLNLHGTGRYSKLPIVLLNWPFQLF